ncbi:hypothetical protein HMPREF0322_03861, partial [Desulfitobacterium hafniense DP7]
MSTNTAKKKGFLKSAYSREAFTYKQHSSQLLPQGIVEEILDLLLIYGMQLRVFAGKLGHLIGQFLKGLEE